MVFIHCSFSIHKFNLTYTEFNDIYSTDNSIKPFISLKFNIIQDILIVGMKGKYEKKK